MSIPRECNKSFFPVLLLANLLRTAEFAMKTLTREIEEADHHRTKFKWRGVQ